MRLRTYVTHAPLRAGRIPLLPFRGVEATTRWLVPEGDGWYTYCEADRIDIFSIPDTLHAACLPHHLASYDPYVQTLTPRPAVSLGPVTDARLADIEAKKQALLAAAERSAETRLMAWLQAGHFATAYDTTDPVLETVLDTLTTLPYTALQLHEPEYR